MRLVFVGKSALAQTASAVNKDSHKDVEVIGDAKDPITFGSNHYYFGNILALCIPFSTWEIATGFKYQAWKYPSLLAHRILHFIEHSINYPAEIFEMKKLLSTPSIVLCQPRKC